MSKKIHSYEASDIDTLETDRERMQNMAHLYIPDKKLAGNLHIHRECTDVCRSM